MDILAQQASGAASKSKDNELAKAMFEGTQQYRKKLKLPEMNDIAEKFKHEVVRARAARTACTPSVLHCAIACA